MDKKILNWATLCSRQTEMACSMCDSASSSIDRMTCEERFAKAIVDHNEKYGWHDLRKDKNDVPQNEEAVEIAYVSQWDGKYYTVRAFHEDGTMHSEDSLFGDEDLFEWCEYDEDADDYIIPVGWFEYTQFGGYYIGLGDVSVVAWRNIEPYESED